MVAILARQYYYGNRCYDNRTGRYYTCNNSWSNWGRWVLLGVIILAALLIFFLFSCITARRRRKLGYQPYRGTAWTLGRTPQGHAPATYNQQQPYGQQQQQPYYGNSTNAPPAYNQPTNGAAGDYYGQRSDVQQPGATYQGYNTGAAQYQPPAGKPPGH